MLPQFFWSCRLPCTRFCLVRFRKRIFLQKAVMLLHVQCYTRWNLSCDWAKSLLWQSPGALEASPAWLGCSLCALHALRGSFSPVPSPRGDGLTQDLEGPAVPLLLEDCFGALQAGVAPPQLLADEAIEDVEADDGQDEVGGGDPEHGGRTPWQGWCNRCSPHWGGGGGGSTAAARKSRAGSTRGRRAAPGGWTGRRWWWSSRHQGWPAPSGCCPPRWPCRAPGRRPWQGWMPALAALSTAAHRGLSVATARPCCCSCLSPAIPCPPDSKRKKLGKEKALQRQHYVQTGVSDNNKKEWYFYFPQILKDTLLHSLCIFYQTIQVHLHGVRRCTIVKWYVW